MLYSMTGFASKTLVAFSDTENPINISLSLKALNSRFFETTCKLPYSFNNLETEFIKLFKAKLSRGHIYFTIHASRHQRLYCTVKPNIDVVKGYVQAITDIQQECSLQGQLTLNDLLVLPNIFSIEEQPIDESLHATLFEAIEQLITEVIQARKKEGLSLKKDLEQRIITIQHEIETIERTFIAIMEQQKTFVHEELGELDTVHSEIAEPRRQILYAMLDKIDIHEEIVRFKSHLGNFVAQLTNPIPEKGKKLDFTLQELAREINTIAAKCSDSSIASMAINIKVELEKAREQVQNIV